MSFRNFVFNAYKPAVEACMAEEVDPPMVENAGNGELTVAQVRTFMRRYGIVRGINADTQIAVAKAYIAFANERALRPFEVDDEADVSITFRALYLQLARAAGRLAGASSP